MNDTFGIDQGVLCETVGRNPDGVNNHVAMIPKVASPTLGWRMKARWANRKFEYPTANKECPITK
jgi:hypothetical protein